MIKLTALIMLITSFSSHAEYRVYQYLIKNKVTTASDQKNSHLKTSTLNPTSYLAYNGGSGLISVDLIRTWVCPGDTRNFKSHCESPYAKLSKEMINEL